jgi:hypothetical protein
VEEEEVRSMYATAASRDKSAEKLDPENR